MREMRAIAFVTKLVTDGKINGNSMKHMLIHGIMGEELMSKLSVMSKLNADLEHLLELKETGRMAADAWLAQNFASLGQASTIDLRERYL